MQKIVLFIEPSDDAYDTPFKSGHLFMNRFSIGEEANFEIVKILELGKSSRNNSYEESNQKGMSLSTLILNIGGTTLDCIIGWTKLLMYDIWVQQLVLGSSH